MRPEIAGSRIPAATTAPRAYVLAPTLLEYWVARRAIAHPRPIYAGMRLARWHAPPDEDSACVVVCGLAGALVPRLVPGAVLLPETVGLPGGGTRRCDVELVAALAEAARRLGFQPEMGPLLTAPTLITGAARAEWAARGFVAADMETGLLAGRGLRVATVRVVLDTPIRSVSQEWLRPSRALLQPALWGELLWMGRVAGPYAARAARIAGAGLTACGLR